MAGTRGMLTDTGRQGLWDRTLLLLGEAGSRQLQGRLTAVLSESLGRGAE